MDKLKARFSEVFGGDVRGLKCAHAPGRVNLIGEHTDYNGGFVMPMAIDRQVRILFRSSESRDVRLWSENYGEEDRFDPHSPEPSGDKSWSNYIRGTAWAMKEAGFPVRAFEGILYGDVPIGAGLSSSAALEVAAAMALLPEKQVGLVDRKNLALTCQKAENDFVGVNCGIMDQFVSLHASEDHAVLIDCRSLDSSLLPLDSDELTVVVANTMAGHELTGSAYNERRSSCERAAAKLDEKEGGISSLRDVSLDMLQRNKDALTVTEYRRARHVLTENDRALRAVNALRARDWRSFGEMMIDSHRSLRDDYEVSCPELDIMVELALECDGVFGARMTGAGFGGCTVNLVDVRLSGEFAELLAERYESRTGIAPDIFRFKAAAGAGLIPVNCR